MRITPNAKCQRVLELALWLVAFALLLLQVSQESVSCSGKTEVPLVTGSIARRASRRYLIYSEADFEVFRPAGATRCTDGGEIWHGGGDRRFPPPCQISPHRCNDKGVGPQN